MKKKHCFIAVLAVLAALQGFPENASAETGNYYAEQTSAQNVNTRAMTPQQARRAAREAHRKAAALQNQLLYRQAVQALKENSFAIEVDQLVFPRGYTVFVSSMTNFVYIDNGKAVIQVAPSNSAPGPNGVGGITVDGTPSNIQMKTDNKGVVYYTFMDQGIAVSATVTIQLTEGNNRATVTINPTFSGNDLTLTGTIVPFEDSRIYKGMSI